MSFLDLFLHLDQLLPQVVAQYGNGIYLLLFAIIFAETGLVFMPLLPGDSLLFVAGTLAHGEGGLHIHALALLLMFAAFLGDTVNYLVGRHFGLKLFANPNSKIFRRDHLDKTHAFYEKHGGKTIIIARFVPIVRTLAPFVAGVGKMSYRRFIAYNIVGGVVWVGSFVYGGYFFGQLPLIRDNLTKFILLIIVVSLLPGLIEFWRHRKADKPA